MEIKKGILYDFWANNRVNEQIKPIDSTQALSLLSHIAMAQKVWLSRILQVSFKQDEFSKIYSYESLSELFELHKNQLLTCVETGNLEREIRYKNLKGEQYESILEDILFHVVIHGQHHRAQIAKNIREKGGTPLPTVYIFYICESKNNIQPKVLRL